MLVWMQARNRAFEVRNAYKLEVPVDLYRLCEELGIRVLVGDLGDASGLILKERGEDATIYLNERDTSLRQRFTLAHELGHYFERIDANDDSYSFRDKAVMAEARSSKYGLMEFYADEFAGELLMPEEEFRDVYRQGGAAFAGRHFGVSPSAASKRHQRLEYSDRLIREAQNG